MTLHICHQSPTKNSGLQSCLRIAGENPRSAVLLIESAVYATLPNLAQTVGLLSANTRLYALREDLAARGLLPLAVDDVTLVDYSGFVKLVCTHENCHSW